MRPKGDKFVKYPQSSSGLSEALASLPSAPDPFGCRRTRTTEVGPMRLPSRDKFMKHPQITAALNLPTKLQVSPAAQPV